MLIARLQNCAVITGSSAVLLAILCGCASTRTSTPINNSSKVVDADATAHARVVAQRLGQTPAASADVIIRMKQPQHDAEIFQLHVWCDNRGQMRILATKLDVEFCAAVIATDGNFRAFLPRTHVWTHGNVHEQTHEGLSFFSDVAFIAGELTDGPLPLRGPFTSAKKNTLRSPLENDHFAEVDIDASSETVSTKRVLGADGSPVMTMSYGRYREFDDLQRAVKISVHYAGDPTEIGFNLRTFDALPELTSERLHLDIPEQAQEVSVHEFLQQMEE